MTEDLNWRKSSFSDNEGGCVEVAAVGDGFCVRDSKAAGNGPVLGFTAHEWDCFVQGVRAGEFD